MANVIKGTLTHGPKIVRDGLVLYMDATNTRSYPGSGTAWYDMSGRGYDAGMVGSVTFSSTFPKSFNYTNTPNYFLGATSLRSSITSSITISSWVKVTDVTKRSVIFDEYETIVPYGYVFEVGTVAGLWTNTLRFFAQGQNNNYSMDFRGTTQFTQSIPYMMTATFNYDTRTVTMYLNNWSVSGSNAGNASSLTSDWSQSDNYFTLGSYRPDAAVDSSMYQYTLMIYNKVLSVDEINQNYHAMRGRFGLT